jgi:hypothetical protein
MSVFGRTQTIDTKSNNSNIIYYIAIGNLKELTKLVNRNNINNIISIDNGYTALHYAIAINMSSNKDSIIKYFLSIDAEPSIKTLDGHDSYELSLKYQSKILFDYEFEDKNNQIKNNLKTINEYKEKNSTLESNNTLLLKKIDDLVTKHAIMKRDNTKLLSDLNTINKQLFDNNKALNETLKLNSRLSESLDEKNEKNVVLINELSTLKRKYSSLEEDNKILNDKNNSINASYLGAIEGLRKKK